MTTPRAFSASSCARDSAILCATMVAALYLFVGPAVFDLGIPLSYYHDGMSHGFVVKTILDVGWYPVHTPFVGAPFGSDLFDYPFSDGLNFLFIDPDECIDCTLCEPECPAEAIFSEDEVPADQKDFLKINAELAKQWPVITEKKPGPADGKEWDGKPGKRELLER